MSSGDLEYLVQWQGFEPEEATWEPAGVLEEDVPKVVQKFQERKQKQ
jgi:hypothetical protein